MTYFLLIGMSSAFLAGFLFHIVWWRIRRPRDDARALFFCVVAAPALLTSAGALSSAELLPLVLIFHICTGFTYMGLYTAAQAASPTSLILLFLGQRGDAGALRALLHETFTTSQLSGDSLEASLNERFLVEDAGGLRLAARGTVLVSSSNLLRGFLGLPEGRG